MCSPFKPAVLKVASSEQLALLKTPDAVQALQMLSNNGWVSLDKASLDAFFAADSQHPAKEALSGPAYRGGVLASLQLAIILFFGLAALFITSFEQRLTPVTFSLWTMLGIGTALVVRNHPKIFDRFKEGAPKAPSKPTAS